MPNVTAVYYTSNRERPEFESAVIKYLLLATGDVPIVSVSQKPMDLGTNICVGDVGRSNHNIYRQLQIGAMAAKTKFIATAESDCLYPAEYFRFEPPSERRAYKCNSLYMMFHNAPGFYRKQWSLCAMVVARDYLIARVDNMLRGRPEWAVPPKKEDGSYLFKRGHFKEFSIPFPVINIKTTENLHRRTWVAHAPPVLELPFWGKEEDVRREMFR